MAEYAEFLETVGITQSDVDKALALTPASLSKEPTARYYTADSQIHGTGVFALNDISNGDIIGILMIGDEWTEAGRYTNHSSSPNTKVMLINGILTMVASSDIDRGTELTADYVQVRSVKEIRDSVLVVDDFCHEVESVVESAHAAGFAPWSPKKGSQGKENYKGMGFLGDHAKLLNNIIPNVEDVILPNSMFFRLTDDDTEQASVHSDREMGNWTCVVYLSEHEQPSGTTFYKHIPTGLTEMPCAADLELMSNKEELLHDIENPTPEKWESIGYVEGEFNRAVIFYAPLFHSRTPVKGQQRLVWVTHFFKVSHTGQLF